MSHTKQQIEDELYIFREFINAAPLSISEESIVKQNPPKPDILCALHDGRTIAFELTEAVDPNQARVLDLSLTMKEELREHYESLSEGDKIKFDKLYGDADLFFGFRAECTKGQIRRDFAQIFRFLLSFNEKTEVDLPDNRSDFPETCERISVAHGVVGPMFNSTRALYISAGILEGLKAKFNKRYESPHPIELIVHSDTRPLLPIQLWMKKTSEYIEDNLQNSPFRRVWIFDLHNRSIEYVFPPLK